MSDSGKVIRLPTAASAKQILQPATGAEVFKEVYDYIRDYSAISDDEAELLPLFAMMTHAVDVRDSVDYVFDSVGYVHITSPEPECGAKVDYWKS